MLYKSTGKDGNIVNLKEALLNPLPLDGGLYLPQYIPKNFLVADWKNLTLEELCLELARPFLFKDFLESEIINIVQKVFNFDIPLYKLNEKIFFLELWHGPTNAFKDVGVRFLARLLEKIIDTDIDLLVATSGDTGAAVANGFHNVSGVKVHILYPKNKVSLIQESQIASYGDNIFAYCVDGTFDDCQKIVKRAFLDEEITSKLGLSSANSINIGRLIPQIFYYFYGISQVKNNSFIDVIVPSGNFGNFTAAILAKMMGAPIEKLVAVTNANDTVPRYLKNGKFEPHSTIATIANAMDVSIPSNLERIWALLGRNYQDLIHYFDSRSFSDDLCRKAIKEVYQDYNYIMDPHTSTGYLAASFLASNPQMVLSTAHPAKFLPVMETIVNAKSIKIPENLYHKDFKKIEISNNYDDFKNILLS